MQVPIASVTLRSLGVAFFLRAALDRTLRSWTEVRIMRAAVRAFTIRVLVVVERVWVDRKNYH
jgi:hypothetical protein